VYNGLRSLRANEAEEKSKEEKEVILAPRFQMEARGVLYAREEAMARISNEVKDFLKNYLAFIATADEKGMPNVVPKGDIAILDDNTIVFADLYAHQTKKNLLKNPKIAITVVNPAGYKGFQLKGAAKIIEQGKTYDLLAKRISDGGQLKHPNAKYAVKVKVIKIIDIGYGDSADKEI